mgnify:CR=1 FL=1
MLCLKEAGLCSGLDASRSEDHPVLGHLHESCLEIKRNKVELKLRLSKKQKSSQRQELGRLAIFVFSTVASFSAEV